MVGSAATKVSKVEGNGQVEGRRSPESSGESKSAPYQEIMAMQRNVGNRAVNTLLGHDSNSEPPTSGIPRIVQSVINNSGQPLDPTTRMYMESRFGHNFGDVRVHTDSRATDSAEAMNAKAYTVERNVVFSQGRYAPGTNEGKRLLAHELAHVVQQSRQGALAPRQEAQGPLETAARQAAQAAVAGSGPVLVAGAAAPGVACEPEDDKKPKGKPAKSKRRKATKEGVSGKKNPEAAKDVVPKQDKKKYSRASDTMPGLQDPGRMSDYYGIIAQRGHDVSMGVSEQTKAAQQGLYGRIEENRPISEVQNRRNIDDRLGIPRQELQLVNDKIGDLEAQAKSLRNKRRTKAGLDAQGHARLEQITQELNRMRARRKDIGRYIKTQSGRTTAKALDKAAEKQRVSSFRDPADPDRLSRGGKLGDKGDTHVVIRVVNSRTGETVARAFGKFEGADIQRDKQYKKHAEQKALPDIVGQLEAQGLYKRGQTNDLQGYRIEVVGDREVCERVCGPFLSKFAASNSLDRVDGFTFVGTGPKGKPLSQKETAVLSGLASMKSESEPRPLQPQHLAIYQRSDISDKSQGRDNTPAQKPSAKVPDAEQILWNDFLGKPPQPDLKVDAAGEPPKAAPGAKPGGKQPVTPSAAAPLTLGQKPVVRRLNPTTPKDPMPTGSVPTAAKPTASIAPAPTAPKTSVPIAVKPPAPKVQAQTAQKGPLTKVPELPAMGPLGKGQVFGQPTQTTQSTSGAGVTPVAGRGMRIEKTTGANGRATAHVEEIFGSSPPMFKVTLTINIEANTGLNLVHEGRIRGQLSGSASASVTGAFTQKLSAEEKDKYLAAVRSGSGGAYRELSIVEMAAAGRLDEAKAALKEINAATSSAEGAKKLAEGATVELTAEGTVGGTAGASGVRGRGSIGGELGFTRTGRVGRMVSRQNGKIVISITVYGDTGVTVGGSAGYGVGSMGYTHQGTEGATTTMTFVLDPNDPAFDAEFKEISAVSSKDSLQAVAQSRPELLRSGTKGTSKSIHGTTNATVAGVGLSVTEGGTYGEEETKEGLGVSHTYTGTGVLGGSLLAGGKRVSSSERRDTFTGTVGPGNRGEGQTSSTKTEIDFGKSAEKFVEQPLRTVAGLVTGNRPALQERVDTEGKVLIDDSYARLAELAKNPATWQRNWHGTVSTFVDWEETRQKVLTANGDRQQIAKALAEFESKGSGRSRTVENAVGQTGIAFEFPDALADQKPAYDALVAGDPFTHAREIGSGGDARAAVAELNAVNDRLGTLMQTLQKHQEEFNNPAHFAEMMRRISVRRTELRAEIKKLSQSLTVQDPGAAKGPIGQAMKLEGASDRAADMTSKPSQAEEPVRHDAIRQETERREERNARLSDLVPACLALREKEQASFARVEGEFNRKWFKPDVILIINELNKLKEMYTQWDALVTELRGIYQERGESPDRANPFAPNRIQWEALHGRAVKW
jgi:hypothetical protein